jgi:hypothetical protein
MLKQQLPIQLPENLVPAKGAEDGSKFIKYVVTCGKQHQSRSSGSDRVLSLGAIEWITAD